MSRFHTITFTPDVRAAQERLDTRRSYSRMAATETPDVLGEDERAFIAERDSFYMASVGAGGWPYVQHRGGPRGFVHVLDERTLAFADYRGNRQYISVGNVTRDDRVALIFMDYPNRQRLKVLARVAMESPEQRPTVVLEPGAKIERVFVMTVEGFDWNCPQHITPRYTEDEIAEILGPRIAALESELARLKGQTSGPR
jgi:predicted pyridoxine 5'-phosphate oxidase superfamily flavin-nucleotide-binding protein